MPERVPLHLHWDPESIRTEVLDRAENAVLSAGSGRVRAMAVPLFRAVDKELEQAVRIESDSSLAGATVSIAPDGGSPIDRVTLGEQGFDHLFVPEVNTPFQFMLTLETGDEAISAPIVIEPQRKWSIHLVHHSHFDYGYTDPQPMVMDTHLRYLDAAIDLVDATSDWPEDAKFRWNIEVTFPLRRWMANRPPAMRAELIRQVKEGRMEIGALPFSMHTETYSMDELAWGLRYTQQLRDEYGVEIVSAFQSDVPGAVVGLLTLLTDADIRYLTVAHNYAGRSVPFRVGGQDLTRPFWWTRPGGRRLLVWYTDTPHGVAYMDGNLVGLAGGEGMARRALPDYLASLVRHPYPYGGASFGWSGLPADLPVTKQPYPHDILHFRIQSSIADNAPPSLAISETVRDWNATWAWPKVRLSRNRDFFEIAEAKLGDAIDSFSGDWTDWWADGIGSGAYALSLNRTAQYGIRAAQSLHTAADLAGAQAVAQKEAIDDAYEAMALFDEHTWGSGNPWTSRLEEFDSGDLQWHRKSNFAHEAYERTGTLIDSGIHRLASAYSPAAGALASLLVFDPVGFERDAVVRAFLPAERVEPGTAFRLIDPVSGNELPYAIEAQPHPRFRALGQWVVFAAPKLPSVGYARFDLVAGEPAATTSDSTDPFTVRSPFYDVQIDPAAGFITSIVDRETGRELVDSSAAHGFGEYIYDRYTSAPLFNHLSGRVEALDLTLLGERSLAGYASVVARESNAVVDRITLRLVAPGTDWLETTISLPKQSKQVLIEHRMLKQGVLEKESVYFAFPFAVDDADPEYAITGGVTSFDAPHVPGSVRHMQAIRDWVGMQDDHGAVAWVTADAPLIELQNIVVPYAPFPPTIPDQHRRSTIYSWALNNIWDTNFPPQQRGELVFRYAIESGASIGRRELAIRAAAALTSPPVALCLRRSDAPVLPPRSRLLSVSHPLVEIVHLEPAPMGDGFRALLLSLADEPVSVEVTAPGMHLVQAGTFLGQRMEPVDGNALTLAAGAYLMVELQSD